MAKTDVDKAVDEIASNLPFVLNSNELYRQFIGMTEIERAREEDYVLRSIMKGLTKTDIIKVLQAKHPDYNFSNNDMNKFIARNPEMVRAMGKEVTMSARRHLEAKAQCSEILAGVALYTQDLIIRMKNEGDHTNEVAAIRALNGTLENYMKLEGMTGNSSEEAKVVNIIQTMSDNKISLKERVHNANFKVIDINKEDGKVQ